MNRWLQIECGTDLNLVRVVWFVVGCGALTLGALGAVLPVLPTTPFIILAAFAFGKSAPRLREWLEESRTFGPIIADWRAHGAIAPRFKVISMAMMCGVFGLSLAMSVAPVVLIVQGIAIAAAAAFILSRPGGPT